MSFNEITCGVRHVLRRYRGSGEGEGGEGANLLLAIYYSITTLNLKGPEVYIFNFKFDNYIYTVPN